jgi:tripartite ATP-independent transporter DctM subunit
MTAISPEVLTLLMLGGFFVGVFSGYPLALVIGTVALFSGFLVYGNGLPSLLYSRAVSGPLYNFTLLACPLFIFMGLILEHSGITEKLFDALYVWLGGIRGGLAVVTILIGTIIAATVGVVAASVTMLSVATLPAMVKRGYDKSLASGVVCAAGCLGILIPPSVMLVFYGPMAQLSVGRLFFGAFIPGFLLSALYLLYVLLRCYFEPQLGPAVPIEERKVPLGKKVLALLTSLVPPVILVLSVLGVIYSGIASPTEAAGIGSLAAILLTVAYRKFSLRMLFDVSLETVRIVGFIFLIVIMAFAFVGVFIGGGGGTVMKNLILSVPGGAWGAFIVIQLICFFLGFFIDWIGIVFILIPIITPIAAAAGFDAIWFAMMICINLQMSFITPPFAMAIFFLRGSAPPELNIALNDIIRGIWPFVALIIIGLALCVAFPELILWLPSQMIR